MRRRLLTIGHSYAVALNRGLPARLADADDGWEVVVAAPARMNGDLRTIALERRGDEGVRVVGVPLHLQRSPHLMGYGGELRRLLQERWDLVHCWEEPYVLAGFQVSRWARAPVVYYTFQNLAKRYPPPFSWFERVSLGRSAGWIAAGHEVRRQMLTRPGYTSRPHATIPLGVDVDVFRPDPARRAATRRKLAWTEDGAPVVGYLGRFVPEKGLHLLMRVLDRVARPRRVLLVGGGPMEAELRAWAARDKDHVRVITGVPHDEVPSYLNAMDVLLAPSRTTPRWREQLGRMLIEAFACGLAVAGSGSGEIPHVVGEAGLVMAEDDETGWVTAVADLLDSPARRAELGARGRLRAEQVFAWPRIAELHLAFFERVLDGP